MATLIGPDSHPAAGLLQEALEDAGVDGSADGYCIIVLASMADADEIRRVGAWARTLVVADPGNLLDHAAWDLLATGVDDIVPFSGAATVEQVIERVRRWRVIDSILQSPPVEGLVVGRCPAQRRALLQVIELARFGSGPILLVGETGTGKEVAARLAHTVSARGDYGPLVVLDCTTIVPTLSGSELFGHERGAFTGAERARTGAFAAADGGTLFLDEIGELPLELQAELLRVLQEHTYKRVGSDTWVRSDFRLVSATHRDLLQEQREGRFRSDLYHRIASGVVRLPPLRERREDLQILFSHFLRDALGTDDIAMTPPVATLLQERHFPGNLRELRQLATAIAARHSGAGPITPGDVPPTERPRPAPAPRHQARHRLVEGVQSCLTAGMTLPDLKRLVADIAVDSALDDCAGNASAAAQILGVTSRAVQLRKQERRTTRRDLATDEAG